MKNILAYWLLERLDEPDLFEDGELTGIKPPRNICNCCSLIDPNKLCKSLPPRPPKSPPKALANPAAAELTPPRSPAPLADDAFEPTGGGLFK